MKIFQTKYGIFTSFNNYTDINNILEENKIPDLEVLELLKSYISKSRLIIDIGSNIGIRPVFYTKINPGISVYCFEPRENLFCLLTKNLAENNILNTVLLNNILGHVNGTIILPLLDRVICDHDDIIQLGNGSIIGSENDPIHFVTLDSLKLLSCDIIFIDLKGFDYFVLIGGLNTIRKYKPIICLKYFPEDNERVFDKMGISNDININSLDLLEKLEYSIDKISNEFILAVPIKKNIEVDQIKINPIKINQKFVPIIPANKKDDTENSNDIINTLVKTDYQPNESINEKTSLKSAEVDRLIYLGYQFIPDA